MKSRRLKSVSRLLPAKTANMFWKVFRIPPERCCDSELSDDFGRNTEIKKILPDGRNGTTNQVNPNQAQSLCFPLPVQLVGPARFPIY